MLRYKHTILICGLVLCETGSPIQASEKVPEPIEIEQKEISHFLKSPKKQNRFGKLDFLGGLELSSPNRHFGGISGLVSLNGGRQYLAVSDAGHWFSWHFDEDETGMPGRISGMTHSPILNEHGKPPMIKSDADAEALTMQNKGNSSKLYVGFEGRNRVTTWDIPVSSAMTRKGQIFESNFHPKIVHNNRGIESLAAAPANSPLHGSVIALVERGKSGGSDMPGWILGGQNPGQLKVRRQDDFDLTDAAFSSNGDLLILERRFSIFQGLSARIRRIPAHTIRPGALLDGEVLFEAGHGHQIDNMEALSVHRNGNNEEILTIMSDDNFSVFQSTLFLRFRILNKSDHPTIVRPRERPSQKK